MNTCPNCGATIDSSDSYCRECGVKLETLDEPAQEKSASDTETNHPSTKWHKAIIAATTGWIVVTFGGAILPGAVLGLLLIVSWPLLPISLYYDSKEVRQYGEWPKYMWAYILLTLLLVVPFIPGLVYLWKRRKRLITGTDGVANEAAISREELREELKKEHLKDPEKEQSSVSGDDPNPPDDGISDPPGDSPTATPSPDIQDSEADKLETHESGPSQPLFFGVLASTEPDSTEATALITERMPIGLVSEFESNEGPISLFEGIVTDSQGNPIATTTKIVEAGTFDDTEETGSAERIGSEPGEHRLLIDRFESSTQQTIREDRLDGNSSDSEVYVANPKSQRGVSDETPESTDTSGESAQRDAPVEPSREELLAQLQTLDEQSDRKITRGRMRAIGEYDPEDYEKEFGTWTAALTEVSTTDESPGGSGSTEQDAYTKEEVLEAIAEVIEKVEGHPSVSDMHKYGRMSFTPAYQFFDSWDEAVRNATQEIESQESQTPRPSGDGFSPASEMHEDPLLPSVATAPEDRLTGVVVDIQEVRDPTGERRTAEIDVVTSSDEQLTLDIWKKHNIDWEYQVADRIRLDAVRLKRWDTNDGLRHKLSSTNDFSISLVTGGDRGGGGVEDAGAGTESEVDTGTSNHEAVEHLTGVGGATVSDARALVEAGHDSRSSLEEASLEELRGIPELDDGIALRIKAEVG